MADCSSSPPDEGGAGTRSHPRHKFLSHLHRRRGAVVLRCGIGTKNSDNLLSKDQAPVEPRGPVYAPPKRRSLAVSFGMTNKGDANVHSTRTGGQGAAHQQQEDTDGTSITSSCESSKNAVVRVVPDQTAPPLGEISPRFRGLIVRDTWSEHAGNPDGEFTFRCSSTMQRTRMSTESAGFDLVGSILCGPSESPVSSISSHRYSGRSPAGREEVLDSWMRETIKLRNSVGKRGTKGVPIVSKSLVELAKARREREAIEESEESDSDSTSSSSTSEAANGCHDVGGRIATRGVMRVSNSRSVLPVSPTVVKFRSPAESLSDSTPALRTRKSEYGGRDSEGKKIKGPVRTSTFVISRSAISLTPRVTFKTLTVTEGAPFAPSPLVSDKTPERDFGRRRPQGRIGHGAGKDETRTAGGRHGLSGGDSPLGPVKGSPRVSACPAAAEPTAEVSAAVATAVVASTGDNSPGSTKGALDTVATVAPKLANCRSGPSSTVFRTNDTRRTSAAGYLVSRDSPKKSTVSTLQEGRTSDTPKKTSSTPDMRLTAVQGIARVDRATIGSLLREAKAPQSAGEESPPATLHPYAAHYSENKRESQSQEVKPPEVCRSDQDAVGSGAKPTKGKVSTPRVMDEGGTPQDTMATRGKDADTVKQAPPFKAQLEISGGAAETLDESVSTTSGYILEKLVPELDGSATGPEDSKEARFEAECERPNDELFQNENGEQQSGDQKDGLCPKQCGPAGGAEKEEVGGKEGARRDQEATTVSPTLSADESDREKHPDGHNHPGEAAQKALPNTERTIANDDSRSQARPPAHPAVADSNQPETTPASTKEQENSPPPTRTTATAVRVTVPTERRLDSALRQLLTSSPDPNAILRSPVHPPSSARGGDSYSGGNENDPVGILGQPSHEASGPARSAESARERESASSHPKAPLTIRADDTREPRHVRILSEATATLGNCGNVIRSAAVSSAGLPCTDCCDGDVSCDEKWRSGKKDLASIDRRSATPMEARKNLVVRDRWCVRILTEAAVKIASGGSSEKLTAKQSSEDDHNGADGSTWTQEKTVPQKSRPRDGVGSDTEVVKDALSASFQAETSRKPANNSSANEPTVVSPVDTTGKARQGCAHENDKGVTGGVDRALPASRLALPSTEPSAVARDRWLVRILVKARATLACYGASRSSAPVSLETVSGLLPSVEDDDRCGHKSTGAEQRNDGGGGKCSPSSCRRKRLSLPVMHGGSSGSIGRTRRLCFPIAQARSSEGGVAASVHRWTACGPASSELPVFVDVGSCLVGCPASKLEVSRGRTICIRDGGKGSPGLVKNADDAPQPSQGNPQRSKRKGNSSIERQNARVPTRPPGRAHRLEGMGTRVSRASLAVEKNLAAGGSRSRRDGQDVPVEFRGHIVVSPACWTADGNCGDFGGRGFVAGGSPAASVLTNYGRPLLSPSRLHLPIVDDTCSLEHDDSAPAWAAKTLGLLRRTDVGACRPTF